MQTKIRTALNNIHLGKEMNTTKQTEPTEEQERALAQVLYGTGIEHLPLPQGSLGIRLRREGVHTLADFLANHDRKTLRDRGIQPKTIEEISATLKKLGLEFGMRIPPPAYYTPPDNGQ